MRNKIEVALLIAFFVISIISLSNVKDVKAFGVTTSYWKEKPLELVPGQSIDVSLELQNMVGNENITAKGELVNGTDIARIIDSNTNYFVPLGEKNVKVNIRVTIPSDAPIGKEYTIGVSLTPIQTGAGGGVIMGSSIEEDFPVVVISGETPKTSASSQKSTYLWVIILIIIIIILLIIWVLTRKKVKK